VRPGLNDWEVEQPLVFASDNIGNREIIRNEHQPRFIFLHRGPGSRADRIWLAVAAGPAASVDPGTQFLADADFGVRLCEHIEKCKRRGVFRQACVMGLEGIVAKRRDSRYRSGRCRE
jgi:hypothetical protein